MAVRFSQIDVSTATGDLPGENATTTTRGINAPGGAYEYLVCRFDLTFAADPCAADFTNLLSALRIVINGEVVHDFRAGVSSNANDGPGNYGYLLNSIGGRAYELPSGTTTREGYWGIPLGRNYPGGVNRIEIITEWAAAAGGLTSGQISWWLKMNDAFQTTTTVCPSTSFTHANAIEQVVVRVPQNVPGVVSGILVQNDSAADQLGTQGIRIQPLGDFGMEPSMWRWLNGDLLNGIMYADNDLTTVRQEYAFQSPGTMLLPCFGLSGGDIVLQVDSSAATTRTYTPIITSAAGGKSAPEVVQTQRAVSNTAKTIVARTEN